eukprot:10241397-Lingulodinium_polyedra.AAC.1
MSLVDFLLTWATSPVPVLKALFWQVLCHLAMCIEGSPWLQGSSEDRLQAPLPAGPSRRRTIDPRIKEA